MENVPQKLYKNEKLFKMCFDFNYLLIIFLLFCERFRRIFILFLESDTTKMYFQSVLLSFKKLLNCTNVYHTTICGVGRSARPEIKYRRSHSTHISRAYSRTRNYTARVCDAYLLSAKKEDVLHRLKMAQQFVGTAL